MSDLIITIKEGSQLYNELKANNVLDEEAIKNKIATCLEVEDMLYESCEECYVLDKLIWLCMSKNAKFYRDGCKNLKNQLKIKSQFLSEIKTKYFSGFIKII